MQKDSQVGMACSEPSAGEVFPAFLIVGSSELAFGYTVGLIHAQGVIGQKPDRGDAQDMLHVGMAASVGRLLVTHDRKLARLVREIPGRPLEVVSLHELLARV